MGTIIAIGAGIAVLGALGAGIGIGMASSIGIFLRRTGLSPALPSV